MSHLAFVVSPQPAILRAMLFMVIEQFRGGDPQPVHHRFTERGRMLPDEVKYPASRSVSDWLRCFQLMEVDGGSAVQTFIKERRRLVGFDVEPFLTTEDFWAIRATLPVRRSSL